MVIQAGTEYPITEILLLRELGATLRDVHRFGEAEEHLTAARRMARGIGAARYVARIDETQLAALSMQCRVSETRQLADSLIAFYELTEDPQGRAFVLISVGNVYLYSERYEESLQPFRRAAEILSGIGDEGNRGVALFGAGIANAYLRREAAVKMLEEADSLFQRVRFGFGLMNVTMGRAIYQREILGDVDEAIAALTPLVETVPDEASGFRAELELELGISYRAKREFSQARRFLTAAVRDASENQCLATRARRALAEVTG